MEIKWLKDFLVLNNTGNFRTAAEQRCVLQPAFSRRIQALEVWGVKGEKTLFSSLKLNEESFVPVAALDNNNLATV